MKRMTIRIVTPGLNWAVLNPPICMCGDGGPLCKICKQCLLVCCECEPWLWRTAEPDFNPDVNWWRNFEMGRLT